MTGGLSTGDPLLPPPHADLLNNDSASLSAHNKAVWGSGNNLFVWILYRLLGTRFNYTLVIKTCFARKNAKIYLVFYYSASE